MAANETVVKPENQMENALHAAFTHERIPQSKHAGIDALRLKAWKSFRRHSMPSRKDEAWKRVDFDGIPLEEFCGSYQEGATTPPEYLVEEIKKLNALGVFAGPIGEGIRKYPTIVEEAYSRLIDSEQDIFAALAAAHAGDGFFIYIPAGLHVTEAIRVAVSQKSLNGTLFNHFVWLEDNAQATIILEDNSGQKLNTGACVSVGNIGIYLSENARLQFSELHAGGPRSWKITHEKAALGKDSQLEWLVYALDGQFAKHFIRVDLSGQGAGAKMAGLYLPSGNQQMEFNTRQNHYAPDTTSDLLYKGVLLDEGKSLFSGMIHVSPEAVKTDGYQANRNLIIGAKAHADSLPGLEILADDVRCTHGATVGKIDPTELFYLQSRGLDNHDAQRLIIQGFLDPIIQIMKDESYKTLLNNRIDQKIS